MAATLSSGTVPPAPPAGPRWRRVLGRISRLEWVVGGVVAAVLLVLVVIEPDIVEAPWQSSRAIAAVVGGTLLAAIALVVMVRFGVPPLVRILVLGVPFVLVSWWLLSPFFVDTVVDEQFEGPSIAAASRAPRDTTPGTGPDAKDTPAPPTVATTVPTEPVLLGAGGFVGLAGHDGSGDAGIFRLPDGALVLRLENFAIDNGPDLRLYLVPGADRRSPADGSHYFGALRGNIGNQTYDIPADYAVGAGEWTVLVWCEAFAVEFVAATVTVV